MKINFVCLIFIIVYIFLGLFDSCLAHVKLQKQTSSRNNTKIENIESNLKFNNTNNGSDNLAKLGQYDRKTRGDFFRRKMREATDEQYACVVNFECIGEKYTESKIKISKI
jgi:hypothetical protein